MTAVGFLHTSDVHVLPFQAVLSDVAPAAGEVNLVDEDLLTDARARGVGADVAARLRRRLRDLAERGPDVIVCTCSTLSSEAERLTDELGVPVVRIDRPMAESAVAKGGRVAVVVAVASTLTPPPGNCWKSVQQRRAPEPLSSTLPASTLGTCSRPVTRPAIWTGSPSTSGTWPTT